jgi:hypothetical protein
VQCLSASWDTLIIVRAKNHFALRLQFDGRAHRHIPTFSIQNLDPRKLAKIEQVP